jgi:hypothetical protein
LYPMNRSLWREDTLHPEQMYPLGFPLHIYTFMYRYMYRYTCIYINIYIHLFAWLSYLCPWLVCIFA